jgi:hypothetical protein
LVGSEAQPGKGEDILLKSGSQRFFHGLLFLDGFRISNLIIPAVTASAKKLRLGREKQHHQGQRDA